MQTTGNAAGQMGLEEAVECSTFHVPFDKQAREPQTGRGKISWPDGCYILYNSPGLLPMAGRRLWHRCLTWNNCH